MKTTRQWQATHQITWTPTGGEPDVIDVMARDGSLYTREEYEACDSADWTIDANRRIYFCDGVAPGNGTVAIERIA